MKAVIVLFADAPSWLHLSGEIKDFLSDMAQDMDTGLWLFYHQEKPVMIPEMVDSLSSLKLIPIHPPCPPESFLGLLETVQKTEKADLLIFSGDGLGEELSTRLAFRLNGSSCLKVEHCIKTPDGIEVSKPVYGNHLKACFILKQPPFCISPARRPSRPARVVPLPCPASDLPQIKPIPVKWIKSISMTKNSQDKGWIDADMILVAGQGVKSRENIEILERVARHMGAGLGASRPVVMAAWMDMNRLVGASGSMISPKVCLVLGVSGAGVFNAGIEKAEFIAAVNTDKDAPIFKIADVGIVDDLMAVLKELEKLILSRRPGSLAGQQEAGS